MNRNENTWIIHGGVIVWLFPVVFALNGCENPRTAAQTQILAESVEFRQVGGAGPVEPASTNRPEPSPRSLSDGPMHDFFDHTNDGCPPRLLTMAAKIFGEQILHAWDGGMGLAPRKRYYLVTVSGKEGLFLEKDGDYVHLNSGAELLGINLVVGESKFTRQDFNDDQKVHSLLIEVIGLHLGPGHCPGSSLALRAGAGWLRGTEKDGAILRELCKDPQFTFEGDTWTVVFNVFRVDGGVDRAKVIGEHKREVDRNQIINIEVTPLRPAGTFSWPYMG